MGPRAPGGEAKRVPDEVYCRGLRGHGRTDRSSGRGSVLPLRLAQRRASGSRRPSGGSVPQRRLVRPSHCEYRVRPRGSDPVTAQKVVLAGRAGRRRSFRPRGARRRGDRDVPDGRHELPVAGAGRLHRGDGGRGAPTGWADRAPALVGGGGGGRARRGGADAVDRECVARDGPCAGACGGRSGRARLPSAAAAARHTAGAERVVGTPRGAGYRRGVSRGGNVDRLSLGRPARSLDARLRPGPGDRFRILGHRPHPGRLGPGRPVGG